MSPTPRRRRAEVSQRRTMRRAGSLAVVAATLPNCGDVAPGRSTRLNPSGIGKRSRDNNEKRNQAVAAVVAGSPLTNPTPPVTPHQVFAVLMNSKSRGSARARTTPASTPCVVPTHTPTMCPQPHSLAASQPAAQSLAGMSRPKFCSQSRGRARHWRSARGCKHAASKSSLHTIRGLRADSGTCALDVHVRRCMSGPRGLCSHALLWAEQARHT